MCGFMRPLGLPKRTAGSSSFIVVIAVTWACFKSSCAQSSMRCGKGYGFRSVSSYLSTRPQPHNRRTDFLYGSKHTIKEVLFTTLGWSDRAWAKRLSSASFALLNNFIESHLAAQKSCIVEANFDTAFTTPAFQRFATRYP